MKRCSKCRKELGEEMFNKCSSRPDGLQCACKECKAGYFKNSSDDSKKRRQEYAQAHKAEIAEYQKKYREENLSSLKEAQKAYYLENREERIEKVREWCKENKEHVREWRRGYTKERMASDPIFRLSCLLRKRVNAVLRGKRKERSILKSLGCSLNALLQKLGNRPENADLDHICPLSQARTPEEICKLFHYSNLRWLDSTENRYVKRDKKTSEGEELCRSLLGREWIEIAEEIV
jgi:hypothetical protein